MAPRCFCDTTDYGESKKKRARENLIVVQAGKMMLLESVEQIKRRTTRVRPG